MLAKLGVKLQVQKDLKQGVLEILAKIIFQNLNERIIEEMKKNLVPLIEEYNKKH